MEREKKIYRIVKEGAILVSDGAWGTFLQAKGMKPGECPELWCLEHEELVFEIAKSYIDSGSDMIETNSFGGSKFKLEHFSLSDKVSEINEAAARISRRAAGESKFVLGSIGPTGKILLMGDVSEDELYQAFSEQAQALEKGGADAACIETFSAIDEAEIAIHAVKENTNLEIICTFTFEKTVSGEYKTMMGVSPAQMAESVVKAGADIIGTNCGNGIQGMIPIVKELRDIYKEIPILVHANAGLPENKNGVDVFPDTPEYMARFVPEIIEAGANIIGGCCGTTPEHIKALKRAVSTL